MSAACPLFFDDVEVGQEWETACRVVSDSDIRIFADLTGDRGAVHMDEEFARTTPFQRRIAHGLLGLALSCGLTTETLAVRTQAFVGLREWHFRAPIFIGDSIRVRTRVLEKELRGRGRRGSVVWGIAVLNQDGRVVQEGVSVTLVERAPAAREILPIRENTVSPNLLSEAG